MTAATQSLPTAVPRPGHSGSPPGACGAVRHAARGPGDCTRRVGTAGAVEVTEACRTNLSTSTTRPWSLGALLLPRRWGMVVAVIAMLGAVRPSMRCVGYSASRTSTRIRARGTSRARVDRPSHRLPRDQPPCQPCRCFAGAARGPQRGITRRGCGSRARRAGAGSCPASGSRARVPAQRQAPLTGLANRALSLDVAGSRNVGLIFLDADDFKDVNDQWGVRYW